MWPADDLLLTAWQRFVSDPLSAGAFAELVLEPLEHDLGRQFPTTHPDDVSAAADIAVAWFLRHPDRYDPARLPLPGFLRLIARRDLLNQLAAEGRRRRGRIPWDSVEFDVPARNEEVDGDSLAADPAVRALIAALPEVDRRVWDLMCDGERETGAFAVLLGLADRPPAEQAAEVKKVKDRIKARLKRAGGGT